MLVEEFHREISLRKCIPFCLNRCRLTGLKFVTTRAADNQTVIAASPCPECYFALHKNLGWICLKAGWWGIGLGILCVARRPVAEPFSSAVATARIRKLHQISMSAT